MYGKNLKLALMGALLLISNVTFSQVTERERPKEWDQLVNGARFMDRFLPMKGNKLRRRKIPSYGLRLAGSFPKRTYGVGQFMGIQYGKR